MLSELRTKKIFCILIFFLFLAYLCHLYDNKNNDFFLNAKKESYVLKKINPLPQINSRNDIHVLITQSGARNLIEIGVKQGQFAEVLLNSAIHKYYGIDPWIQQVNYKDGDNADNDSQQKVYNEAKQRVARFGDRAELIRDFSTAVVDYFKDDSIDFVYIDARHDYCGVTEDLKAYWSKVKKNGIMSGHGEYATKLRCFLDYLVLNDCCSLDYLNEALVSDKNDWRVCANGSVITGGVKRAVDEFALSKGLKVYKTNEGYASWYFQKL
jgi:hypothetical protein